MANRLLAGGLGIIFLYKGFCPKSAVEVALIAKLGNFLGQDLVAQHDVVNHVGFSHGLANEFTGAEGRQAEQQQRPGKAQRKPARIAIRPEIQEEKCSYCKHENQDDKYIQTGRAG